MAASTESHSSLLGEVTQCYPHSLCNVVDALLLVKGSHPRHKPSSHTGVCKWWSPHLTTLSCSGSCVSRASCSTESLQLLYPSIWRTQCCSITNPVTTSTAPGQPGTIETDHEVHDTGFVDGGVKFFVNSAHDLGRLAHDIICNTHTCISNCLLVCNVGRVMHHWHVEVAAGYPKSRVPNTHVHRCRHSRPHHDKRDIRRLSPIDMV